MSIRDIILVYLASINIVTFLVYGIDKFIATKNGGHQSKGKANYRRISEATLLWLAVAGGSLGAALGMKLWHHKTMHKKFVYGIPAIIIVQLALAVYVLFIYGKNYLCITSL